MTTDVMPALVAGIHDFRAGAVKKAVDGRDSPLSAAARP